MVVMGRIQEQDLVHSSISGTANFYCVGPTLASCAQVLFESDEAPHQVNALFLFTFGTSCWSADRPLIVPGFALASDKAIRLTAPANEATLLLPGPVLASLRDLAFTGWV